jgi:hypothetical protein
VIGECEAPLMPLGLFRCATSRCQHRGVLWAAAMFAWFFLSALYMQLVLNYTPMEVGLAFLPANLIMGAFSLGLSAKLVTRFGIRAPQQRLRVRRRGWRCSRWAPADERSSRMYCRRCCCSASARGWHSPQSYWRR